MLICNIKFAKHFRPAKKVFRKNLKTFTHLRMNVVGNRRAQRVGGRQRLRLVGRHRDRRQHNQGRPRLLQRLLMKVALKPLLQVGGNVLTLQAVYRENRVL